MVVIDLFCGHETIRPVCEQFGLKYIGVDISEFRRIVQQVQKGEREARSAKKEIYSGAAREGPVPL